MLDFPESKSFEMKCQRVYAVVLILVGIPSVVVISLVFLLLSIQAELPDWLVLTLSFGMVGLSALLTLWAIMKWANIPCTVTLSQDGVLVSLKHRSPFFRRWTYQCSWQELAAASSNYDSQTGGRFYKIAMPNGQGNIYLSNEEKTNTPLLETEFGALLNEYLNVADQLPGHNNAPIDRTNFYQGKWAFCLTRIVLILNALAWIAFFVIDDLDAWQITRFSLFSGIWLSAYYLNKGR